jgi:glycosyltransferase involved in cell wall biosynthesis
MKFSVSVIIPTKNRRDILNKAIDSVLKQEEVNVEVIVVNDGSTDETAEFIKSNYPDILLINNSTSVGGAKARNIGAEAASVDYIAFLDSDDEWLPDHLISKLTTLQNLQADGVYGPFYIQDDFKTREVKFYNNFPSHFSIADKISAFQPHDARTSTLVFKKEAFMKIKFDETLQKHQDWDLAINFDHKYKLVLDNKPTAIIHVDSFHVRMSNNLKHESTLYFLNKNLSQFSSKGLYNFCVKMIMRCQGIKDYKSIPSYLNIVDTVQNSLSLQDKVIYYALKNDLINLNTIRRFKNYMKRAFS